nr:tyrosine-type recombinase/integrase [Bordetella sp. 02P26C-1]
MGFGGKNDGRCHPTSGNGKIKKIPNMGRFAFTFRKLKERISHMATFTHMKAGTVKAEIRQQRKGQKPLRITRTFDTMKEAKEWAATTEDQLKLVKLNGRMLPTNITLGEALKLWWTAMEEYANDDDSSRSIDARAVLKRRLKKDKTLKTFWLGHRLADMLLRDVTQLTLEQFIDEQREQDYAEQTIRTKLYHLHGLLRHARAASLPDAPTGWGWAIDNPVKAACQARELQQSEDRDRRLEPGEENALLDVFTQMHDGQLAAQDTGSKKHIEINIPGKSPLFVPPHSSLLYIKAAFLAAVESAMRREKMFEMQWSWILWRPDHKADIIIPSQLRGPKNKRVPSRLAASPGLRRIFLELNGTDEHGRPIARIGEAQDEKVFGPLLADRAGRLLQTACAALGISNLHWHDLRHEACSRLADLGWSVFQIQRVSGHKSILSLKRYTHIATDSIHDRFERDEATGAAPPPPVPESAPAAEARKQAAIAALEGLPEQPPATVAATPPTPRSPHLRLVA